MNRALVPGGCLACRSTGYSSGTALIGESMAAQSGAPACGWKVTAVERAGTWAASTPREHFPLTDLVHVASSMLASCLVPYVALVLRACRLHRGTRHVRVAARKSTRPAVERQGPRPTASGEKVRCGFLLSRG